MGKETAESLVFRKHDSIGANDAEDDQRFLENCFIDTGALELIKNFENKQCLILGRTGSGKTALLTKLLNERDDRVILINPEALAMQHISNSTIIRYLNELGIELNTLFKLLWRHVLCVEVFNHHFKASSKSEFENLLDSLRYKLKRKSPDLLRALDYLEEWQYTFWKKSDSHVVEMISSTESKLSSSVAGGFSGLSGTAGGEDRLSEQEKLEVKQRAQSIVDEVQMREVANLIKMLNEVVADRQKQYYLVIDKLDEGWVDDKLRYRLIKALIETIRDINRYGNIKPLVVLRMDLLGHVFDITQDTGFQEEKYKSLYLQVRWTKQELTKLLDSRINYLLKDRYSKNREITHKDILPERVNGVPIIDFILSRTLMRPRDVIEFFNLIIRESSEATVVNEAILIEAEKNYSRQRLDSIYYEWFTDYPRLKRWVGILRKRSQKFRIADFDLQELRDRCFEYAVNLGNESTIGDRLYQAATGVGDGALDAKEFRRVLIHAFYITGLIGVQFHVNEKVSWSYELQKTVDLDDLEDETILVIHPCFQSALSTSNESPSESAFMDLETQPATNEAY